LFAGKPKMKQIIKNRFKGKCYSASGADYFLVKDDALSLECRLGNPDWRDPEGINISLII